MKTDKNPLKTGHSIIHEMLATIAVMILAHMVGSFLGVDDGPRRAATLVMALIMGVWASRTGHWYLVRSPDDRAGPKAGPGES